MKHMSWARKYGHPGELWGDLPVEPNTCVLYDNAWNLPFQAHLHLLWRPCVIILLLSLRSCTSVLANLHIFSKFKKSPYISRPKLKEHMKTLLTTTVLLTLCPLHYYGIYCLHRSLKHSLQEIFHICDLCSLP